MRLTEHFIVFFFIILVLKEHKCPQDYFEILIFWRENAKMLTKYIYDFVMGIIT